MKFRSLFGPGTLVTAAFIGPGTLTTCTLAGVKHHYDLLWALAFAGIATIVLQEMAARLGCVTGKGLGEAMREQFQKPVSRFLAFGLVIAAILIGNASYEAGNLSGAVVGLRLLFGDFWIWPIVAGGLAFCLLAIGKYKLLERFLIALVILMSGCFLITACIVRPDISQVIQGFRPQRISSENFLLVMGIIGTTVVPYNLFLHASTVSKKWGRDASLWEVRIETAVAVLLGVLISMLIVITSAATADRIDNVENAEDFALQLQPLAGTFGSVLMGIGFCAAGLSSALTAPIAAAYAVGGLFGWSKDEKQKKFIAVWMTILVIGIIVSLTKWNLIYIIKFAQVANAIVLPFVGVFLLYLANSSKIMGANKNRIASNVLGGLVLIVLLALSFSSLSKVYEFLLTTF